MQGSESAASLRWGSGLRDLRRSLRSPHITVALRILLALFVGLAAVAISANPATAQDDEAQDNEAGELVFSCPDGSELEGEGRNLTCIEITETRIDALTTSNGALSCRDGSTGSPTAENPTCVSEVRNSVRPIITCNGETIVAVGDGDDCGLDSDADGLIDGEDFDPLDPTISEAPAPIETPTEPAADPDPTTPPATTEPAQESIDSGIEEEPASEDSTRDDGPGDDDGGSALVPVLVVLGLLGVAAAAWMFMRGRNRTDADAISADQPPVPNTTRDVDTSSDATASAAAAQTAPNQTTPKQATPTEAGTPDNSRSAAELAAPSAHEVSTDSATAQTDPGQTTAGDITAGDITPEGNAWDLMAGNKLPRSDKQNNTTEDKRDDPS